MPDFSADRPIETREQDRLGRRSFAEAIAKAIGAWDGNDSLVVAIYGAWGSGKTSLKNMILEALRETTPAPDNLEFNPWEHSGHQDLSESFFREVGVVLGRKRDRSRKLASTLKVYASVLKLGSILSKPIRWVAALILIILGLAGVGQSGPRRT